MSAAAESDAPATATAENDENDVPAGGSGAPEAAVCDKCDVEVGGKPCACDRRDDVDDDAGGGETAEKAVDGNEQPQSMVSFSVHHGRQAKYPVEFGEHRTVAELKEHLVSITNVPVKNQKLIHNSRQMRDDQSLADCRLAAGAKVMLVGSTEEQVAAASKLPTPAEIAAASTAVAKKEPLCKQKVHEKVVKSGPPDDAMVGIRNIHENLPLTPLTGMRDKYNRSVRLTFKLELDQLWIATSERTTKLPMGSISNVVSEPIENHENYCIMGLHAGSTDASIIWFYWVPAQYVAAIKRTILN